jgi:hypothetical protein
MLKEQEQRALTDQGLDWIREQQRQFRRVSRAFFPDEKQPLEGYFNPEILALARIAEVYEIENPPFLSQWISKGLPWLLDFRQMAGITFIDTIVTAKRFYHGRVSWISLLFHEMVHVVQYQVLTADVLIKRYLQGWLENGFDYYRIPIEVQAYSLQREFDRKVPAFSVEDRIR